MSIKASIRSAGTKVTANTVGIIPVLNGDTTLNGALSINGDLTVSGSFGGGSISGASAFDNTPSLPGINLTSNTPALLREIGLGNSPTSLTSTNISATIESNNATHKMGVLKVRNSSDDGGGGLVYDNILDLDYNSLDVGTNSVGGGTYGAFTYNFYGSDNSFNILNRGSGDTAKLTVGIGDGANKLLVSGLQNSEIRLSGHGGTSDATFVAKSTDDTSGYQLIAGGHLTISGAPADGGTGERVTFSSSHTAGFHFDQGITTSGLIKTTSTADAASPNDDAASIRTSGGAAIAKVLRVGNHMFVNGAISSETSGPMLILQDTTSESDLQVTTIFNSGGETYIQARNDTANGIINFRQNNGTTVTTPMRINATGNIELSGNIAIGGNATITGDLTVNGTTTTINTTNLDVTDNIIGLNNGLTVDNTNDSGIIIERGDSLDNAAIIWDESIDKFVLGTTTSDASSIGNITITPGDLEVNTAKLSSGVLTLTDVSQSSDKTITATGNDLTFANVHGIFENSIGLRNERGSVLGMEAASGSSDLKISSQADIHLSPTGGDVKVTGNLSVVKPGLDGATPANITGVLQSNNNRSVVIGELAAPSETAPNTEADPVVYRENIAIGYQALNATSSGTNNVAIGTDTLKSVSTGKNNIAIGKRALETVNSDRNIALGFNCLNVANVSTDNIVIGVTNLQNTTAGSIQGNTIIGRNAGNASNVGTGNFHDNVILGRAAFNSTTASKVEDCIFIGDKAGKSLKGIGDNDIGIGRNAFFGSNLGFTSGGNNIAIGQNTQSNSTTFTRIATAKVNGATSSSTTLVVDNNSGNGLIDVGMVVAGTGISGTPTVITVTDQNNLVLSSAQTLSDNVDLTFTTTESITGSIKIGADGGKAGSHSVNISTVDTSIPGAGGVTGNNREVNDITGSHSGLIAGYANTIAAETAFIGAGHDNTIATSATGAAILGGFDNEITGVGSAGMALGSNLKVQGANQVVVGRFNVGNNNSKFIVGSGFSNANRINAFEVKNNHQIKLGKYGVPGASANFKYDGNRNFNILAVGGANNVVEIPLHDDKLDSQYLNAQGFTVSTSSVTFLPINVEKIVVLSWTGSTGTAQVSLPESSNHAQKTIRIITNGTIPDDGIVHIRPGTGSGDTFEGSTTSGIKLRGKYQSAMVWSDGAGSWSNIGLDSTAVKFDEADNSPVTKIRKMDQNTYDGLVTAGTIDDNTLYIIVG